MPVWRDGLTKMPPLKVNRFCVSRPPFTFMVGPLRASVSACGLFTLTMPGRVTASAITLRPFSGKSTTRRSSTRPEIAPERVSTSGACSVTVTSWEICPIRSARSTRRFWFTVTAMPARTNRSKPAFSAASV